MKNFVKLLLCGMCLLFCASTGWGVEQTVVYLAAQTGQQDTGSPAPGVGSMDSYLKTLEAKHGALKENRRVNPKIISFDFYKTTESVASGFGLEIHLSLIHI